MTDHALEVTVPQRGAKLWPAVIFGLLGLNMTIVAVTVYFATSDRSAAIEPQYYQRAAAYEDTLRQGVVNARLGWTAQVSLDADAERLLVTLRDASAEPIEAATVTASVFANIRSADRQQLTLAASGRGQYTAPVLVPVTGRWRVRLSAQRGTDVWTDEREVVVSSGSKGEKP